LLVLAQVVEGEGFNWVNLGHQRRWHGDRIPSILQHMVFSHFVLRSDFTAIVCDLSFIIEEDFNHKRGISAPHLSCEFRP